MPDFSKIWATNSPLPEFNFTDEQYLEGWDFVDAAPPTKNQFDAWFRETDKKLKWLYDQLQNTATQIYPVGSVYISFNSANPATLFGGVWQRLKDTFLLANGDAYAPNTSGGSATKNITVDNLPNHTHSISVEGNHTHTRGSMNIVGQVTVDMDNAVSSWGALQLNANSEQGFSRGSYGLMGKGITLNAANGWSGETSWNGLHTHVIGNTGNSLPLNIMPPYTTVYVWRRTA